MKIIFSKKGFDTSNGGWPSPILPDGSMYSIPIPAKDSGFQYSQIDGTRSDLTTIMNDLSGKSIKSGKKFRHDFDYSLTHYTAHNDPYWIEEGNLHGYILGQQGASQGHLRKQEVGKGDLFLFYGVFQKVEMNGVKWCFVPKSRSRYTFFGWLLVDEVVDLSAPLQKEHLLERHPGLTLHPHIYTEYKTNNTLYLPMQGNLKLNGDEAGKACSGRFSFHEKLYLSSPFNKKMSTWILPQCFSSLGAFSKKPEITHIGDGYIELAFPISYNQEIVFNIDKADKKDQQLIYDYLSDILTIN